LTVFLTGVRKNPNVILLGISFVIEDVEHFFMCLVAIYILSWENYLFNPLVYSFTEMFVLFGLILCVSCTCWILIFSQMSSWQRFSPIL
jgi:hypothetical protein